MNINIQIASGNDVDAWLWAGNDGSDNYQISDAGVRVNVSRESEDRIGIHALLPDSETEDAGIYMTKADALTLSALLAAAVVDAHA